MVKERNYENLSKIMIENKYSKLKSLCYDNLEPKLLKHYKNRKKEIKRIDFFVNLIEEGDNSCEPEEYSNRVEFTIEAKNDEIIIAHEVAHSFAIIYDFPMPGDFEIDYFLDLSIKLSNSDDINNKHKEIIKSLKSGILSFGQHFMVKKELENYFEPGEIEERWTGENGTRHHLFKKGNFTDDKNWMFKEGSRKESILKYCIQFNKALTIADLYFALDSDKQKIFEERVNEKETDKTKEVFKEIKNIVKNVGIVNLEKSDKHVKKLYEKIIGLAECKIK